MDIVLAQFFATPIPEPVSLGLVLGGLAVVWFRSSQIIPSHRKANSAPARRTIVE
jgi:hypothetical protein